MSFFFFFFLFFLGGGGGGATYFSFHKNTKKFMFGVFKTLGHYTEYFNLDQNYLKRTYAKICCFTPISLLVQGKYFHLHHIHSDEKIK